MVLRQCRQGEERSRQHGRVDRPLQRQDVEREDQSLGSRPRRLATLAASAAAQVGPSRQRAGGHERK